jgi:hypothetical protein
VPTSRGSIEQPLQPSFLELFLVYLDRTHRSALRKSRTSARHIARGHQRLIPTALWNLVSNGARPVPAPTGEKTLGLFILALD